MDSLPTLLLTLGTHTLSTLNAAQKQLYNNAPKDLQSLLILLAIIYLSLQIFNMAARYVYAIVMLFVRIAFLVMMVGGGFWVYHVGWAEALSVLEGVVARGEREVVGVLENRDGLRDEVWRAAGF